MMGAKMIDLGEASKVELVLESSYTSRDVALYALGVGAGSDPLDDSDRRFVYERGEFHALPTFAVIPQSNAMLSTITPTGFNLPGMSASLECLLHGEQYTELRAPLPTSAKLKHLVRFKNAYDKAPNAVVEYGITSVDESGRQIMYNEISFFVIGGGGWGGDRGPSAPAVSPPDRAPDAVIEEKTAPNQALLYRLSGDWNPLHADPAFARRFGFDRPILHGLCTFGYLGRHVMKAMFGNDPHKFKSIKVRFAEPVFPGETLVSRMWREGDTRVIAETIVKERGKAAIKNGVIESRD